MAIMLRLIFFLLLFLPTLAHAVPADVNFYVKASCANHGDGTTADCAASPGAAGAYNKLSSALTSVKAYSSDFVTDDIRVILNMIGSDTPDTNTDELWIYEITTNWDAGQYLWIKGNPESRYLYTSTFFALILHNIIDVHISNIHFRNTAASGDSCGGVVLGNASTGGSIPDGKTVVFDSNIVERTGACTSTTVNLSDGIRAKSGDNDGNDVTYIVTNNVVKGFQRGIFHDSIFKTDVKFVAYNNTSLDATELGVFVGTLGTGGTCFVKNNISDGSGTSDFSFDGACTTAANFSSDATSPQTDNRNKTFVFVDADNSDYHLDDTDASGAKEGGVDLSADSVWAFSHDFDGDARVNWDAGADEFDGGAPIPGPCDSPNVCSEKVTIDNTVIDAALTSYPVFVDMGAHLSETFWERVGEDCKDVRAFNSDFEEIPAWVSYCNIAGDDGALWVTPGTIASDADTDIYIVYGSGDEAYAVDHEFGRDAVWSAYTAVWMLDETNNTDAGGYVDATGNGFNLTGVNMGTAPNTGILPFSANVFNGSSDYIRIASAVDGAYPLSYSAWFYRASVPASAYKSVISQGNSGSDTPFSQLSLNPANDSSDLSSANRSADNSFVIARTSAAVAAAEWHMGAGVFASTTSRYAFHNGTMVENTSTQVGAQDLNQFSIGALWRTSAANFFEGRIQNVRLASTALPEAWLDAEYVNILTPATFYSVDAVEVWSPPITDDIILFSVLRRRN